MQPLRRILIAGGGSSGWMTAALFARLFQGLYDVVLVESAEIGTIGVGEATIPAIKKYNELLGLDENEFITRTQGTFKLGIQFNGWLNGQDSYIHGFGVIGQDWEWLRMHHYWLRAHELGRAGDFADYSINTAAALKNKFLRSQPNMADSPLAHIAHAFQFDAALFAKFLSGYAQDRGVRRREGKIVDVTLRPDDGFIQSVTMADGEVIEADLFIDCSGFRGLFINQALGVEFEDWSHWLPCNRAIAVPCERSEDFTPYTRSTAHGAGWQWRIPLQHRTGNGHVFSTRFMDDAEAEKILLANIDGKPLADPFKVDFKAGKRRQLWHKNCVAVGLAGGFLEPLESTSLHLVQSGIIRLVRLLPDGGFNPANVAEFNRQSDFEYERIRDFIILHYKATTRADTPFWDYCRTMELPETLQRKIDLWMANGRIFREDEELFSEESWIQVFLGQGMIPRGYDPLVQIKSDVQIAQFLGNIQSVIGKCVDVMPSHADYVAKTCPASQ
ncbi:MAG: tryptophan 7-halogenase [Novosphingobium sp.]|jgi:tryptophan halogenase|nr:tryptophan 7-halogenase [Novosphingobium sp.]